MTPAINTAFTLMFAALLTGLWTLAFTAPTRFLTISTSIVATGLTMLCGNIVVMLWRGI